MVKNTLQQNEDTHMWAYATPHIARTFTEMQLN